MLSMTLILALIQLIILLCQFKKSRCLHLLFSALLLLPLLVIILLVDEFSRISAIGAIFHTNFVFFKRLISAQYSNLFLLLHMDFVQLFFLCTHSSFFSSKIINKIFSNNFFFFFNYFNFEI